MSNSTSNASSRKRSGSGTENLNFQEVSGFPLTDAPKRNKRSQDYEQRVNELLSFGMKMLAQNEGTLPDAAALIQYGPGVASKAGDLADKDERVRKAIDFITTGTENPYASLAIATLPLVLQILRNHETTDLKTRRVSVKVPFTKREISLPFRFRLKNKAMRSITVDPTVLMAATFSDPAILAALQSQGINVTLPDEKS